MDPKLAQRTSCKNPIHIGSETLEKLEMHIHHPIRNCAIAMPKGSFKGNRIFTNTLKFNIFIINFCC